MTLARAPSLLTRTGRGSGTNAPVAAPTRLSARGRRPLWVLPCPACSTGGLPDPDDDPPHLKGDAAHRKPRLGADPDQNKDTQTAINCGIVGLPNVGSGLDAVQRALTETAAASGQLPFCHRAQHRPRGGSRPATGRHRRRIAQAPRCCRPSSKSWTSSGWSEGIQGEGLGNQFLANIRETDAILRAALLRR